MFLLINLHTPANRYHEGKGQVFRSENSKFESQLHLSSQCALGGHILLF